MAVTTAHIGTTTDRVATANQVLVWCLGIPGPLLEAGDELGVLFTA